MDSRKLRTTLDSLKLGSVHMSSPGTADALLSLDVDGATEDGYRWFSTCGAEHPGCHLDVKCGGLDGIRHLPP